MTDDGTSSGRLSKDDKDISTIIDTQQEQWLCAIKHIFSERLHQESHGLRMAKKATTTLIVDNGSYRIKYGLEKPRDPILSSKPCRKLSKKLIWYRSMPNGVFRSNIDKRTYIGDELDDDCMDHSGLIYRLPFERVLFIPPDNIPI